MDKQIKVIEEVENQMLKELENERIFAEKNLNKMGIAKTGLLIRILEKMLGKLLWKLKIKITIYWDEKELLSYEIPKN